MPLSSTGPGTPEGGGGTLEAQVWGTSSAGTRAPRAPQPGSPPAAGKQVWKRLGFGDHHSGSRSRRDQTLKMEVRVGLLVGDSQQLRPARTSVFAPAARCRQPRTCPRGAPSKATELTRRRAPTAAVSGCPTVLHPEGLSECQKREAISLDRTPAPANPREDSEGPTVTRRSSAADTSPPVWSIWEHRPRLPRCGENDNTLVLPRCP